VTEHLLIGLASILALGVIAQWIAWRLHLPSILILLVFGFVAGPVLGILKTDDLFGELLFPLVSISAAIILFEGGLSLRIADLRQVGSAVRNLTTIAVLVTWVLSAAAASIIVGLRGDVAVLLGAVLVVSGPTVIIPLIRDIRPSRRIGSVVKWEGIVNDPIGAVLAVLVLQVIVAGGLSAGTSGAILGVVKAAVAGTAIGLAAAIIVVILLRRYLVPDFLQNPFSLMLVVLAYLASNEIQAESGLLAVTVMGIALANQKYVPVRHIAEFKENLRVLLISSLFIILASRITSDQLALFDLRNWVFVILLIVIVRPLAVLFSTIRSPLTWRERGFLAWMAPRGIIAAAVVSIVAIRLTEMGYPGCDRLVPLTFQVIVGTVAVYGLTAAPVAKWLKLADPNPQGILFAGASPFAQAIASIVHSEGFRVALIDSNWDNVTAARIAGFSCHYDNVLSENLLYDIQLDGIGRLVALTPNDEVNSLAALHFLDVFGKSEVYQLSPAGSEREDDKKRMPKHLHGRHLFRSDATYEYLSSRLASGAVIKKTRITEEFDLEDYSAMYGESALPLFIMSETGSLKICTAEDPALPKSGEVLVSLIDAGNNNQPEGRPVTGENCNL